MNPRHSTCETFATRAISIRNPVLLLCTSLPSADSSVPHDCPLTFDDLRFSKIPVDIDRPIGCDPSVLLPLLFSRHLKQILKFIQENVRSLLYIGSSILFGLLHRRCHETGCHLKDVTVQRNIPSSSLRPLEFTRRSCHRPIARARSLDPRRILDTIDCQHPASRTHRLAGCWQSIVSSRLEDRSIISSSSLSILG